MKLHNVGRMILFLSLVLKCSTNFAESNGLYLGIDYLYWKSQQDQMFYAAFVPGGVSDPDAIFNNQLIFLDQKFKNNSGVRAKIGYAYCEDWDTCLIGTHYSNCSFGSLSIPNGIIATAIFPIFDLTLLGSSANSLWNLKFNTLDWEIGRLWNISEHFDIRSHIGIKWAKIKQQQIVNYPTLSVPVTTNIQKYNTFNGVGPRFGLNADWCFWNRLSLIGNASASLLYGKFTGNTTIAITTEDDTIFPSSPFCRNRLRPAAEMLLGISWRSGTCDMSEPCGWDTVNFNIGIGYEAQYWWNQWQTVNEIIQILGTLTNNGDLMFHGLTAWASIEF